LLQEEYITASSTILPNVNFTSSTDFVCRGLEVQFEDMTEHVPIQWLWEFEPSTVLFIGGTDETSQHPLVAFTEASEYNVTLTAWNLNGESSVTVEDYITVGGYIPFFKETFEEDIKASHWTIENPDDEVTWEIFETGGTTPGNMSAGIDFSNYFKIGQRDRLISPPFNLNGMSNAALEFRHAFSKKHEDYSDSLIIYVSKDCGEDWVRIYADADDGSGNFATQEPMEDFWPQGTDDWCGAGYGASCIVLDLSPWTGESGVRIAFESFSSFGNPMFIDNVTISQFVGTEENELANKEVSVYPNPTNGTFNVVLPEGSVYTELDIVNYLGQSVYSDAVSEKDRQIQITPDAGWTPGIYFLRLSGNGISTTKKLIMN
jgi:PKD repeat protein